MPAADRRGRGAGPGRHRLAARLRQPQPRRAVGGNGGGARPHHPHPLGLPATVRALAPGEGGLPDLPMLGLGLHRADAEPAPATARLAVLLQQAVADAMAAAA
jgi:hypothetical protein